ncbi:hypothetical protein P389DRAFT_207649 [Cystobasidium minutum MCA 4210]|uniref:uncharacterized protein n=1 Tax=Cystobasidium minutum MCA 4210 TaxID=1397322 RepID=UPI0034CE499F|eukprot:jgi/Rhomi1/207649/estExt_Genemark1.C_1_t20089
MSLPTYLVAITGGVQFAILNSLVAPLPFGARKAYLRFIMKSNAVAKFVYFLKIVHIFIAVLFVDAFRTAYVVTLAPASERFDSSLDGGDPAMTASSGSNARKLLAERNMNLTAMSLFTFYLLWRVYELSMENVRYGEIALAQQGVDTGAPIEEHRQEFKDNYNKAKPDHDKDIRNRGLNKNEAAPVPDVEDTKVQ